MAARKRYVLAGTGGRGLNMFARPLLNDFTDTAELVGLFDQNATRMQSTNTLLEADLPCFTDFDKMLSDAQPDCVVVCTQDSTHEEFIVRSLAAGKRVYSEKPICTTAEQCRTILAAEATSSARGFCTHNMRYGTDMVELKRLLGDGKIGKLLAIEFRETLDRSHGADYFRRWHRYKEKSGGLLIHKASHHFDVLNWLADAKPVSLTAMGATIFYGKNGPFRHDRCRGCPHAEACDFHIDMFGDKNAQLLYLDAEKDDGYIRDGCVFAEDITAEDQAAVLYHYDNDVRVSYSLLAFAAYEGMLIVLEGTEGRLEYNSVHSTSWAAGNRIVPGMDESVGSTITYFHPRQGPETLAIPKAEEGSHGGADPGLRRDLFARDWDEKPTSQMAPLAKAIQAVLIGVAANDSIAQGGAPINVQGLLKG